MPHILHERREVAFKIVYYGPGMSGKTTNLVKIHEKLSGDRKGDMVSLATAEERTLFFDFFPLDLGTIAGYTLRFNTYTVPGQVYYEASRRLILDGADAVVFVADSQSHRLDDNLASYRQMLEHLQSHGLDPGNIPVAMQYNKRDCAAPLAIGAIESELALDDVPIFEAVATRGIGVMETMADVSRRVIRRFDF